MESDEDCIAHLTRLLAALYRGARSRVVLVVGEPGSVHDRLCASLTGIGLDVQSRTMSNLAAGLPPDLLCVTSSSFESRMVTSIARELLRHDLLRSTRFEYILSKDNYNGFEVHDSPTYTGFYFINPLLQDEIDYQALYDESLNHFELKCDVRDYVDICQIVSEVVRNRIPGDFVEFGSYKGHSGYLIARLLQAHGSDKTLHMFDTFESFPGEQLGIDAFWSNTHPVSFDEVRAKLEHCSNARLVQGEFQTTVPHCLPPQVAFAYVDCDSYRATKYLMEHVYDRVLARGGIVAFEDYGHPALLGNRIAVDEFFANRPDCTRWFSQFSGIYTVKKG